MLIIDEAQEMETNCMNELRLLGSAHFDSGCLLTTVMCGDMRLPDPFRTSELVALGSRIQLRMNLEPYDKKNLFNSIDHSISQAGAPHIMSTTLMRTLTEHAVELGFAENAGAMGMLKLHQIALFKPDFKEDHPKYDPFYGDLWPVETVEVFEL